jgi:antitoxin (DNA-binding transcriptional repressor) of toxin-antitoxin stability system
MRKVGIFEAKNRLSSICQKVAELGETVLIEKRGHPLAVIGPVPASVRSSRKDIHSAWREWEREHPGDDAEFPEVWRHRTSRSDAPLDG